MLAALTIEERLCNLSDERRDAYVRGWARSLLKVLDVVTEVQGPAEPLAKNATPTLVVANHRSVLDILLVLQLFGGQLLARGDMASWPAIGAMARRAGTLFVDRNDPSSGAVAVRRMRERLRRGITVSVFPEGTTHAGDDVRPFQPGAFLAIVRERGHIVPVGFAYERPDAIYGDEPVMDHMKRLVRTRSIRVGVAIGAPLPAVGPDVATLAERVRGEVEKLVHQARGTVGGSP
jgi:1-acyl-sn-glycerol-3-phosphate acyltransferase